MKLETKERISTLVIIVVSLVVACTLSCGWSAEYIQWITESAWDFIFSK